MTDFQASATEQGKAFEAVVLNILLYEGWAIVDTHATVEGVEIDIVATDPSGAEWWIECKGSHRGKTPGSKRGDTVKKAVGVAWFLSTLEDRRPYLLVTSHLPKPGTVAARLLDAAVKHGLFADVRPVGLMPHVAPDDLELED